jgi:hypothetical protein
VPFVPQATPEKSISIVNGVALPEGVTQYEVDVTSKIACFPLPEPTSLYVLPSDGSSALGELYPVVQTANSTAMTITVDQTVGGSRSGTAALSLEIVNNRLRTPSVAVKAVWGKEQIERFATAVPLPTLAPSQPTGPPETIEPATAIPRLNVTATATPVPTTLPAAQPAPTTGPGQISVRVCVQPNQLAGATLGGDNAVIWGLTTPGVTCFPYVGYNTGEQASGPQYLTDILGQTADANGLVRFPFHEMTQGTYGIARVTCVSGNRAGLACQGFTVSQSSGPPLPTDLDQRLANLNAGQPCPLTTTSR